jgi:hypothetical protein
MKSRELQFETPPQNQGQIVEYSYAETPSGAKIERRYDGSARSVEFYWRKSGRRLTATERARYGLVEPS